MRQEIWRITPNAIVPHIKILADDLLEGRAPGSRGEKLATKYIASQMESFGLEPAGEAGTYFQKVPLVGIQPALPKTMTVKAGSKASARQRPIARGLTLFGKDITGTGVSPGNAYTTLCRSAFHFP